MTEKLYEIPEDCDFMAISNSDAGENQCSPRLLDPLFSDFSGLLINGPKKVIWPKEASLDDYPIGPFGGSHGLLRLMIAGIANVAHSTLGQKRNFRDSIVLVAVDQSNAKNYTGITSTPDLIPEPEPEFSVEKLSAPEDMDDDFIGAWFNVDLVSDLGLPITEAIYSVYATLGDYKSNVLTIRTVVK